MADYQPSNNTPEIWKSIPIAPEYEASSWGRVRSIPRTIIRQDGKPLKVKGGVLQTSISNRGYERFAPIVNGKPKRMGVHQAVAAAFLPAPDGAIGSFRGQYTVNHIDGNKLNNLPENLEYVTSSQNVYHAHLTGLNCTVGISNGRSKLTEDDVRAIRAEYSGGVSQVTLARKYGIDQTNISRVILRQTWKHVV